MNYKQLHENIRKFRVAAEAISKDPHYGKEETLAMIDGLHHACVNISVDIAKSKDPDGIHVFIYALLVGEYIRLTGEEIR